MSGHHFTAKLCEPLEMRRTRKGRVQQNWLVQQVLPYKGPKYTEWRDVPKPNAPISEWSKPVSITIKDKNTLGTLGETAEQTKAEKP